MACAELNSIIDKFDSFTQKPANYLAVQSGIREDIKNLVKSVYDYTKAEEKGDKKANSSALPELIIRDFDEEQIWQQLELQNSECWDQFVWDVANCMSSKQDLVFPVNVDENEEDSVADEEDIGESTLEKVTKNAKSKSKKSKEKSSKKSLEEGAISDSESEKPNKRTKDKSKHGINKKSKTSVVDDEFFKLSEMEKFLLDEEKKEGKNTTPDSDEESLPLFEDIDDDDEEQDTNMMYTDFFDEQDNNDFNEQFRGSGDEDDQENGEELGSGSELDDDDHENEDEDTEQDLEDVQHTNKKKDKKVTFADGSSDDESSDENSDKEPATNGKENKYEKKSEFELRQQRLQQQISKLEDKTLSEAPWQLKGEVDATKRPQNSLLQEVVDFDLTSRPAPIITEQTTVTLEEIINRRIKDKAWDDVVRKEKPVEDQLSFRKTEIIDQSKSKQSLAQVYEAEYLKQKQALSGEVEDEKEPESHTQIRDAMSKLFSKLDALCHYHYTPKAPQAEVKIVSNTPAISMEEVAPVATSDAALLAPEEVKKKRRGDLISKEERSQTDKNRERRKKKKLQRKKGQVTKVTDTRNTKKGVEASDKSLKTSKAFFQQLNDDSSSLIKNKRNVKNKGQ